MKMFDPEHEIHSGVTRSGSTFTKSDHRYIACDVVKVFEGTCHGLVYIYRVFDSDSFEAHPYADKFKLDSRFSDGPLQTLLVGRAAHAEMSRIIKEEMNSNPDNT